MREEFEAWAATVPLGLAGEKRIAWLTWQAAVAWEREEVAKECDAISEDQYALYKGRTPYTGSEPGRANPHTDGMSDGAAKCANAIRARRVRWPDGDEK